MGIYDILRNKSDKDPNIICEESALMGPHIVCEEKDMSGPPIVCKETDLRGSPCSMRGAYSM